MLTGVRPFVGDDVSKTLARVIDREPDWSALPKDVPAVLDNFLRGCLEKDPRRRVRDIGDVRLALEATFETPLLAPAELAAAPQLRVWQRPAPALVSAAALLVLGGLTVWSMVRPEATSAALVRFSIVPTDTAPLNFVGPLHVSRDLSRCQRGCIQGTRRFPIRTSTQYAAA